jgi:hypothetical protein
MPIDPSIPLAYRPAQILTPAEAETRMLTLAQMEQAQRLREQQQRLNEARMAQQSQLHQQRLQMGEQNLRSLQLRAKQDAEKLERAERIRSLLAEKSVEEAMPEIMKIDPEAGFVFQKRIDEQKQRQLEQQQVVPLPENLAKLAGMEPGTKISTKHLDDLIRADAYNQDVASRIEARKSPKPVKTEIITDNDGNVSAVSVMPDGTVKWQPVEGVTGKAAQQKPAATQFFTDDSGKVSAVSIMPDGTVKSHPIEGVRGKSQQSSNAPSATRIVTDDAGNLAAVSVMKDGTVKAQPITGIKGKTSGEPGGDPLKKLEALRQEELRLEKEEQDLGARRAAIGAQTTSGKVVRNGKPHTLTAEERAALDAEYKALDKRWGEVQTRKQQIADQRAGLKGLTSAPSAPVATQAAQPPPQTYTEAQVRERAKARGINPDDAVKAARAKGLIR